ncbi:aldo/keto reductase [Paenibacillus sp. V4I7]|uniref:aldo/keto reductase n=1 Tax=Paenibacillus sp. V4I7 TaxID=3042307 RepID=UPI0027876D60|nr:aldo/keto reductase [Paenibacillus sp. V4I7]MDQ0899366.1 aryl-alcohol dehydrogenase-like predicted oxidoreductase [Paenibacillus sp. V4I7]
MKYKSFGSQSSSVSAIGLGLMGMSDLYGQSDRVESIATIHEALEQGITLFDTGDFYGSGHNELLLGEALQGKKRDQAYIAVKFGALRTPDGGWGGFDARPESVKNFLAYSLKRLNVEYIDLYQPARVDPNVPIEEVVGAIADMVKAGYVRHIGLSEAGADTIRRAHAVHPITSLQIEYSLFSRGIEEKILPTLRELGISLTAYGVLSRGLLSGSWSKERALSPYDFRGYVPRFQGENLDKNLSLVEALREIAEEKQITVAQLAIAWILSQGEDIVPIIGARRRTYLKDVLGALNVNLAPKDLEAIQAAIPPTAVSGDRYYAEEMAHLDSEK